MPPQSLQDRISCGEDSYTQFKSTITKPKDLAKEMVAFANSEGGIIIVGVADNGTLLGLSPEESESLGQLVGNVANEAVRPPIHPLTQSLRINNKLLMVITIPKGSNKPYATSSGDYLIKSGPDKKTISREELRRLFAQSSDVFPDEIAIEKTNLTDLNHELFYEFLNRSNPDVYTRVKNGELELDAVLQNLELQHDGHLTLAGNLIFGKLPQSASPSFYIDCAYFDGNDVSVNKFISKDYVKGTFGEMYKTSLNFIKSNLRKAQTEQNFNTLGRLEIDENIFIEAIVNALVHRDYFINASIKIFIFHDRIEIISPGKLTNSLTVEKIMNGIAIHRNPILNSICKHVLPYSGYGSGIKRIMTLDPRVQFVNDIPMEQFKVIIPLAESLDLKTAQVENEPHTSNISTGKAQSDSKKAQLITGEAQSDSKKAQSIIGEAQSNNILSCLIEKPLSAHDLAQRLGKESKSGSLKRTLKEYLELGCIEYTIPEKPNSRLQKYRLTAKGQEHLESTDGATK